MTDDYLIRVPAEWLTISDDGAWIDADRLGMDGRAFPVVGTIPSGALNARMDYESPLQPGETRHYEDGNSLHMHKGSGCPCIGGVGGGGSITSVTRHRLTSS